MDFEKRKIIAGLTGLAAAILFIGMLFFLGLDDRFASHGKFSSTFIESVQGLTVGSPVKYRGVPIGSVSEIIIRTTDKRIVVKMDISLKTFPGFASATDGVQLQRLYDFFQQEVNNGLRCRLDYTSMATGMRYVELDYYASPGECQSPDERETTSDGSLYIPSTPSAMQNILASVTTSLDRISRVRFEEISDGIIQNLKQLNGFLNDPAIRQTIAHVESAAEKLNNGADTLGRVFSEEKLQVLLAALEKDLDAIERLAAAAEKELENARIAETSSTVRNTFSQTAANLQENSSALSHTLFKLNRTLDNLHELIELLRDDPSSIISGKRSPAPGHQDNQ